MVYVIAPVRPARIAPIKVPNHIFPVFLKKKVLITAVNPKMRGNPKEKSNEPTLVPAPPLFTICGSGQYPVPIIQFIPYWNNSQNVTAKAATTTFNNICKSISLFSFPVSANLRIVFIPIPLNVRTKIAQRI